MANGIYGICGNDTPHLMKFPLTRYCVIHEMDIMIDSIAYI